MEKFSSSADSKGKMAMREQMCAIQYAVLLARPLKEKNDLIVSICLISNILIGYSKPITSATEALPQYRESLHKMPYPNKCQKDTHLIMPHADARTTALHTQQDNARDRGYQKD